MKRFAVLGLVVCAGFAQASFELLMVADNGAGTFATRKIHRFDPQSGVYLGSFGGFSNNIISTHVDQASNSLYVFEATGISRWNYNTGMMLSHQGVSINNFQYTVRPDEGRMACFDGASDFLTFNFGSNSNVGFPGSVGGALYRSGIWFEQNTIIAWDNGNRVFRRVNMDAAGVSGSAVAASSVYTNATYGQMSIVGNSNNLAMAAGSEIKVTDRNAALALSILSPYGTSTAAAAAHDGFFVGGTNAGVGQVTYFDRNHNMRAQFGNTILANPVSMQTVLAPEPGTFVAVGAGVAALLRRRKKS